MSQIIAPVDTLPDTGVDWLLIHTPKVDVAINPHHCPMAYSTDLQRWLKIFSNDGVIDNYFEVTALDHYFHA